MIWELPGSGRGFTLAAAAKVNLYLRVVRRREDGFHEVETLLQSVGLWDELDFVPAPVFSLSLDRADLPSDERNLVRKAAGLLRREFGLPETLGAAVSVRKRIPVGAGMGGGSADAAAALVGLARLWGLDGEPARLEALAARIGSDVPFFLRGGAAVGTGRGERLQALPGAPSFWLVLIKPPFSVSTAWAYRAWTGPTTGTTLEDAVAAVSAGDPLQLAAALRNDLEAGVASAQPEIAALLERLLALGALGARMTGSGSVVFGIARDEASARGIAARLDPSPGEVYALRTVSSAAGDVS